MRAKSQFAEVLVKGDENALFALSAGKHIFVSASRGIGSHPRNVVACLLQGGDGLCGDVFVCEQPQGSGHLELQRIDFFGLEQAAGVGQAGSDIFVSEAGVIA